MNITFEDHAVVVSGAAHGIGRSIAHAFTSRGARVFAFDIREDELRTLVNDTDSGADGKVFNIGSTEEISIEALADKIIAVTGSKSEKQFLTYEQAYGKPFDDMLRRVPCLRRINGMTGYVPRTDLTRILRSLIPLS